MKQRFDSQDWYPRLVNCRNWEIPVPGPQAVIGFFVVLGVSLMLYFFVLWLCSLFRS